MDSPTWNAQSASMAWWALRRLPPLADSAPTTKPRPSNTHTWVCHCSIHLRSSQINTWCASIWTGRMQPITSHTPSSCNWWHISTNAVQHTRHHCLAMVPTIGWPYPKTKYPSASHCPKTDKSSFSVDFLARKKTYCWPTGTSLVNWKRSMLWIICHPIPKSMMPNYY